MKFLLIDFKNNPTIGYIDYSPENGVDFSDREEFKNIEDVTKNYKEEFPIAKKIGFDFLEYFSEEKFNKKNPIWKEITKANPDITAYSLRHRFAHMAHKGSAVPISVKDCAVAMGHSPSTHLDFYGSYTTELAIEKAFERCWK